MQDGNKHKDEILVGKKNDSSYLDKPPIDLVPMSALFGMARAFGFGASKYGRHNFRQGIHITRCLAAAMRHIGQYLAGEDTDTESHLSHLDHALAAIAMAKYMETTKPEFDDRYEKVRSNETPNKE